MRIPASATHIFVHQLCMLGPHDNEKSAPSYTQALLQATPQAVRTPVQAVLHQANEEVAVSGDACGMVSCRAAKRSSFATPVEPMPGEGKVTLRLRRDHAFATHVTMDSDVFRDESRRQAEALRSERSKTMLCRTLPRPAESRAEQQPCRQLPSDEPTCPLHAGLLGVGFHYWPCIRPADDPVSEHNLGQNERHCIPEE